MVALTLAASIMAALDQLSKRLVSRWLAVGQSVCVGRYFQIRHARSKRLALPIQQHWLLLCTWTALATALVVVLHYGVYFRRPTAEFASGMALGGAASNIVDFVRCGYVIDMVDVGVWPVFNLADAAILLGVILALWRI